MINILHLIPALTFLDHLQSPFVQVSTQDYSNPTCIVVTISRYKLYSAYHVILFYSKSVVEDKFLKNCNLMI